MNLVAAQFEDDLEALRGNVISLGRGYFSEKLIETLNKNELSFFGTFKLPTFPFTDKASKSDQLTIRESGVKREFWARKKVSGKDTYALAFRESNSSAVATMITNIRSIGPGVIGIKPRARNRLGATNDEPASAGELAVSNAIRSFVKLTESQVDCLWFAPRPLRVTSTGAYHVLKCAAQGGLMLGTNADVVLSICGIKKTLFATLREAVGSIPTRDELKKKSPAERVSLAKSILVHSVKKSTTEAAASKVILQAAAKGEEGLRKRAQCLLNKGLISAWFLKPFSGTKATRNGKRNESYVLKDLPTFMLAHGSIVLSSVRKVGLLAKGGDPMSTDGCFATSVDGLAFLDQDRRVVGIEMKCAQAFDWVSDAELIQKELGSIIRVIVDHSTSVFVEQQLSSDVKLFHRVVPKPEYRMQVLHHAFSLGINRILFVVSKTSETIYVVDLTFSETVLGAYGEAVKDLRAVNLPWSTDLPDKWPNFTEEELGFAGCNSDLKASARLSYNLSRHIMSRGSAYDLRVHYLRSSLICLWNSAGKIGTDTYSRYLSHVKLQTNRLRPGAVIFCDF